VSFVDCEAFTWSLGCTVRLAAASRRAARVATTSFTFMFVEVPDPVWNTSTGNWSSHRPAATSSAAAAIAAPSSASMPVTSANCSFAPAHAALMPARACTTAKGVGRPEAVKFSSASRVACP
jgi:hypothetical protein